MAQWGARPAKPRPSQSPDWASIGIPPPPLIPKPPNAPPPGWNSSSGDGWTESGKSDWDSDSGIGSWGQSSRRKQSWDESNGRSTWEKSSGGGWDWSKKEDKWEKTSSQQGKSWDKPSEGGKWPKSSSGSEKPAWGKPKWGNKKWTSPEDDGEPDVDLDAEPHFLPAFMEPPAPVDQGEREEVEAQREEMEVKVIGESSGIAVAPITAYSDLDAVLPSYVTSSLAQNGIEKPMPIQAQTLPFLLSGFDLIGIAKTGSGKTLAFILPAIAHIERLAPATTGKVASPIALVLAPVRELAVQIMEEANKIFWHSESEAHPKGVGAVAIYGGGMRIRSQQIEELKKGWCQMLVATPGRMVDFLEAEEIKLDKVVYFVLDEADRMLDSGFGEQMDDISDALSPERQTLFFSATWPLVVRKLAKRMCKAPPIRVNVGQTEEQVDGSAGPAAREDVIQEVIVFDGLDWKELENQKKELLNKHVRELLQTPEHKILVFVNTKQMTWELAEALNSEGFQADFMYGGRSQDARAECVRKFKEAETKLLVTTDVMARGLDIPNISHVVVYDCYGGIDEYVHRIGRTARGLYGKGHALTFFEYDAKYSEVPGELVRLLEGANQVVPPELRDMAEEVENGTRPVKHQKKW